jgi:hypothetical protein
MLSELWQNLQQMGIVILPPPARPPSVAAPNFMDDVRSPTEKERHPG